MREPEGELEPASATSPRDEVMELIAELSILILGSPPASQDVGLSVPTSTVSAHELESFAEEPLAQEVIVPQHTVGVLPLVEDVAPKPVVEEPLAQEVVAPWPTIEVPLPMEDVAPEVVVDKPHPRGSLLQNMRRPLQLLSPKW